MWLQFTDLLICFARSCPQGDLETFIGLTPQTIHVVGRATGHYATADSASDNNNSNGHRRRHLEFKGDKKHLTINTSYAFTWVDQYVTPLPLTSTPSQPPPPTLRVKHEAKYSCKCTSCMYVVHAYVLLYVHRRHPAHRVFCHVVPYVYVCMYVCVGSSILAVYRYVLCVCVFVCLFACLLVCLVG